MDAVTAVVPLPRTVGFGFGPDREFAFIKESYPHTIEAFKAIQQSFTSTAQPVWQEKRAHYLGKVLVDIDILALSRIFSQSVSHLTEATQALFYREELIAQLDLRFIHTLAKAMPENTNSPADWSRHLTSLGLVSIDPQILAYFIPAMLEKMSLAERSQVFQELQPFLKERHFNLLHSFNYWDPVFSSQEQQFQIKSNGRTLIFKPQGDQNTLQFRGLTYIYDHTHFHLEGEGQETEFRVFNDNDAFKLRGTVADPNRDICAEVHTVFVKPSKKGPDHNKIMVLAKFLRLGEENPALAKMLESASKIRQLATDNHDAISIDTHRFNYQELFMKHFSVEKALYFPFGTLNKKMPKSLQTGVRVYLDPDPMMISRQQYESLSKIFGTIQELPEEKVIDPIDRFAHSRNV